jgi:hypothetical protein
MRFTPLLDFADEAVDGMAGISTAIAQGQITLNEGAALSSMITSYFKAIEGLGAVEAFEATIQTIGCDRWRPYRAKLPLAISLLHKFGH